MYVAHDIKWRIILKFAWKFLIIYTLYSTAICSLFVFCGIKILLPALPITILGTAVAFYIGFKNNSSYDRLWEARRIWGSIVNASRTFGIYVLDYIDSPKNSEGDLAAIRRDLIMRHLAYINALRVQLRRTQIFQNFTSETAHNLVKNLVKNLVIAENLPTDQELKKYLSEKEADDMAKMANAARQLLRRQSEAIAQLHKKGLIDDYKQVEFGRIFANFYDQQGACERIKSFPYPRQYAYFSKVFAVLFVALLPFALLNEFQKIGDAYIWLTIPTHVLVSWVFVTMELVGDNSENPFENSLNDVPMSAICRTIEIDLLQMLGEKNVPPRLQAVNDILM